MASKLTDELLMTIRDEFVHGVEIANERHFPSIDELCKTHDVSRSRLYAKAKENDWQSQKNSYQTKLQMQLDEQRMGRLVSDSKKLDDNCIQIAQAMLSQVGRRLQQNMELQRQDSRNQGIDPRILSHMSNTVLNAQKIGKLALGEAQEISKVAADVSNPEAFRAVMEQLDELAATRSQGDSDPIH
jgi:hypothetical protein